MADKSPDTPDTADEKAQQPDDPVVDYILQAVADGGEISPNKVAQALAADRASETAPKDIWRKYLLAVRQQAIHLARSGRLEIVRKGQAVDPNDFKGLYKLRLPRK
jgi:hypothetical protein